MLDLDLATAIMKSVDAGFDETFDLRRAEADRFYALLARGPLDLDSALVQRRALV